MDKKTARKICEKPIQTIIDSTKKNLATVQVTAELSNDAKACLVGAIIDSALFMAMHAPWFVSRGQRRAYKRGVDAYYCGRDLSSTPYVASFWMGLFDRGWYDAYEYNNNNTGGA